MSEHTDEFVLIPKLITILKQKFEVAIPIFPWSIREGNNFSKMIHKEDKFRILGLYPRRPKLNLLEHKIFIKIKILFWKNCFLLAINTG